MVIFGFNGWSSKILDIQREYMDPNRQNRDRWDVGFSCIIRVMLKDGTFHDDVGFGSVHNEKDRGKAIENARKEAVSDGVKRYVHTPRNPRLHGLCNLSSPVDLRVCVVHSGLLRVCQCASLLWCCTG